MPELSIDGRKVEVPPGTNLIEAARKLSIEVPYYCYHPALSTVGSCRMCQIEIHEPGPYKVQFYFHDRFLIEPGDRTRGVQFVIRDRPPGPAAGDPER